MEFITGNLPMILCFVAGFGLLLAEAFMPGFGVAGVLGIILEIIAVFFAWTTHGAAFALVATLVIVALIALTVYLSYRSAMKGRLSRSALILRNREKPQKQNPLSDLVGKEGVTVTPLRPAGTVEIDGQRFNADGGGSFLEKGAKVGVIGFTGDRLDVRLKES